MQALEMATRNIKTNAPDNPANPLGTLQSGALLLAKALQKFPALADAAQVLAAIGGDESAGQSQAQGGQKYNDTVDFMGTPVEIVDGTGDIEGHKIYVSPDGKIVADDKGQVMGRIENGKFVVIDEGQAGQLEQNKMAGRGTA